MTLLAKSRGVSLLETMVVMSLVSTLLLLSAGWLHQSLKFSSLMQARQQQHQSLLRLSRHFRDDVHHSQSVSIDQDDKIVLQLAADRQVAYRVVGQQIIRRTRSGAGSPSEEAFALAEGATADWDVSELPHWISLTVERAESLPELHLRVAVDRFGEARQTLSSRPVEKETP